MRAIPVCSTMLVKRTRASIIVTRGGTEYIRVFVDGSVKLPRSKWLSHAGWGLHVAADSSANDYGTLENLPHTSYRAEARAVLAAVARAAHPISIVIDNLEVQRRLADLIDARNEEGVQGRPIAQHEDPLWEEIWWHLCAAPARFFHTQWCPSHCLDDGNEAKRDAFLNGGGDLRLLQGNSEADKLAEKGALLQAPMLSLQWREHVRIKAARIVHTMQVSIWAAFQGYVVGDQEAQLPDPAIYGPVEDPLEDDEFPYGDMVEEDFDDLAWEGDDPNASVLEDVEIPSDLEVCDLDGNVQAANLSWAPPRGKKEEEEEEEGEGEEYSMEVQVLESCNGPEASTAAEIMETVGVELSLDDIRSEVHRLARHYPRKDAAGSGIKFNYERVQKDPFLLAALSPGYVVTTGVASKQEKVPFRLEWVEPVLWALAQFEWTVPLPPASSMVNQRTHTCSYLEIGCAIRLMSGQAAGGPDCNYARLEAIARRGMNLAARTCK